MIVTKRLYRISSENAPIPVGTCWLARPDIAVTAQHCTAYHPRTFAIADLGAAVVVEEDGLADVAILRLSTAAAIAPPTLSIYVTRRAHWHADGFPDEVGGHQFTMSGHVTNVHRDQRSSSSLQLHLEQGALGAWEGASGAAVVVDGGVIGVVTEVVTQMSTASGATIATVRRLLAKLDGESYPIAELELRDTSQSAAPKPASDPWQLVIGRRIEIGPLRGPPHGPPPNSVFRVESVTEIEIRFQKESSHQYVTLPRHALTAPWGLSDTLPRAAIQTGRLAFDPRSKNWRWEP